MFSKFQNMGKQDYTSYAVSVIGANHRDKGIACQDAATSATMYHKGYKFNFMAVADGHGGTSYTRSDIGSFLALQASSEAVNRFIIFVIDVFEKHPENWAEIVKSDFRDRLGKILVNNWLHMVEAHANETEKSIDEIAKLYGTTVSLAFAFNKHLFIGKIGDGSVFAVKKDKKNHVQNMFDADETSLGLGTASLCSKDAFRKWQTEIVPLDDIKMVFMATDGFADSLQNPAEAIMSFYSYIDRKGLKNFESIIGKQLQEISQTGVGDDISLAIFIQETR